MENLLGNLINLCFELMMILKYSGRLLSTIGDWCICISENLEMLMDN